MSHDKQTISVYDEKALAYAKLIGSSKNHTRLEQFLARLPAGGTVLDLGCGSGESAKFMHEAGFNITATDASSAMVELTAKCSGINVYQSTFEDLTAINVFDGIWANFSLLHASRADFPSHLQRIFTALKQGGIFHIGMKTGTAEGRDSIGRFYSYYSSEELNDALKHQGFVIDNQASGEERGLAGDVEPWIILTASKP